MSNMGNYEERSRDFNWEKAAAELGLNSARSRNIGWLCSDHICEQGHGDRTALLWENHAGEKRSYSFQDLKLRSNAFGKLLRDLDLQAGERVAIFMDRIPELYFAFVGTLKVGGIVQPLFSAFGEDSLETRLQDAETSIIITTLKHARKVRRLREQLPSLRQIVIVDIPEDKLKENETAFDMESAEMPESLEPAEVDSETPSVLHYTSGTTGKPKGALHVHGSVVGQAITARYVLDLKPEDLYWCTADPGWVTGTSYGIIGPWVLGVGQLIFDGGFSAERWYQLLQDYSITVWYSAPTAIRLLMKEGTELVRKYSFEKLRHMCSVGEPLNPEAVTWAQEAFGMPFHDTYWQTETGAMAITNYPGMKVKPGSMGRPFPGMQAAIVDMKTFEVIEEAGKVGLIALKPGWPAMFRTYWQNKTTYESKFKNGWYLTGDRGNIDEDGYFWFVGRDDDVINTGGHLVGPFEIESALLEHPAVAESAAVGVPDPVNMEVVKAFVVLKPGFAVDDDLELSIMNQIRKRLSPLAMPQSIEFSENLPRTRSGKILRRVLRAKEWGEPIGDLSTLEDD